MSRYLKVKPTGHPVLLVAFSHIDTPPGEFSQYHVIEKLPYANILLNCPDNSYYLREIPGVGATVGAIAARLKAEIAALAPERVVFFGNSMGAYGALLYGALLGADQTIAMAPEVLLGHKGGVMMKAAKDKTLGEDHYATALPEIVRGAAGGERICLFGEKAIADMRCALALIGCGAKIIGIRNAFHSVVPYLHGSIGLAAVIDDLVSHGAASPLIAARAGDLLASPRLVERLYEGVHERKPFRDLGELTALITPGASPATIAYAWLAYSRRLLETGAGRLAMPFILAAALTNPGDIEAYALMVRFPDGRLQARGLDRKALLAAVAAHRFDPALPYCRFLAALLIEGEDTPAEVLGAIADAINRRPQVEGRVQLQLAQLLLAHGELNRAEAAAREACRLLPGSDEGVAGLDAVLRRAGRHTDALAPATAG